jgi:hypothetical protein
MSPFHCVETSQETICRSFLKNGKKGLMFLGGTLGTFFNNSPQRAGTLNRRQPLWTADRDLGFETAYFESPWVCSPEVILAPTPRLLVELLRGFSLAWTSKGPERAYTTKGTDCQRVLPRFCRLAERGSSGEHVARVTPSTSVNRTPSTPSTRDARLRK